MLRFIVIFVFLYTFSTEAQNIDTQDKIRVRVLKSVQEVSVAGYGLRLHSGEVFIYDEILPKLKKIHISRADNSWLVVNVSDPTQRELFSGDQLRITGDLLKINGESAAGEQILMAKNIKFDLISELDIEAYLKGVLPSEMPIQWPREALKAQAVAARSYALSLMRERARELYHVDDTTLHQVFHLENYTGANLAMREKVEEAVDGTKGMFLTHLNGDPYRTFFHSDCGGSTEEPKFIWALNDQNGTVKDERCAINPLSAWSAQISRDELDRTLAKTMGVAGDKVSAITVGSNTDSGRIYELLIHFQSADLSAPNVNTEIRALNAQEFRKIFGFNRVKSTNFSMKFTNKSLDIKGRGHGHGAGMCQKGARFMAIAGANYLDILKRYYPGARIKRPVALATASVSN